MSRGFVGRQARLFVQQLGEHVRCLPGGCIESADGTWTVATERQEEARRIADRWWIVICSDATHGRRILISFRYGCREDRGLPFNAYDGAVVAAGARR